MQSFCHNQNQASNQKHSLTKFVTFVILIKKIWNKKTKLAEDKNMQSFRHNLNKESNEKSSLTKVVTFDISILNMQ